MTTKPPTPAQLDTLKAIAEGMVTMGNTGYSSFRISGATPQVVGRLISLGLARWPKGAIGTQICELTDAGRAFLPPECHPAA